MTHLQTNGHNNTDKDKKMERKFNKMEKKTQLKKSGPAKPAYKAGEKENLIQDITNRFRVTAREARDIVTAVGTLAQSSTSSKNPQSKGPAVKNLVKQVKETASAAATGKKGTTSDRVPVSGKMTSQTTGRYSRGSSRS
jgi:hypothetical protein